MDDITPLSTGSRLVDRYLVGSVIGRGGMSVVYRATDESLGRTVAIKVFSASVTDAVTVARQRSEVQLVASFSHPTLITLFDAVIEEAEGTEQAFLVMQYVDGATVSPGPLAEATVTAIGADIADALGYVHERGVIHRDVKPGNILVPRESRPSAPNAYLADFGIARFVDGVALTTQGSVLGTASYLSPEQALGRPLGPATDVYSLGLVLLESLTGRPAFPGVGMEAVAARLTRDPEIPDSISPHLAELIAAMTAADPVARPSADEVESRLRAGTEPEIAATTVFAPAAIESTVAMPPVANGTTVAMPAAGYAPTTLLPTTTGAPTERLAGPAPTRERSRRPLVIAGAILAVALLGGGVAAAVSSNQSPGGTSTTPAPAATPTAEPTQSTAPVVDPVATTTPTPTASVVPQPLVTPPGTTKDKDPKPGKGNGNGNGKKP